MSSSGRYGVKRSTFPVGWDLEPTGDLCDGRVEMLRLESGRELSGSGGQTLDLGF